MGVSRRHQSADHPRSGLLRARLHPGIHRRLHDVHEHTLCLSAQKRIRLPRIRNDADNHLHHIPLHRNLRQDRPTLTYSVRPIFQEPCDTLDTNRASQHSSFVHTLRIALGLTAVNCYCSFESGSSVKSTRLNHSCLSGHPRTDSQNEWFKELFRLFPMLLLERSNPSRQGGLQQDGSPRHSDA